MRCPHCEGRLASASSRHVLTRALGLFLIALLAATGAACRRDATPPPPEAATAADAPALPGGSDAPEAIATAAPYPLPTCAVCGERLGSKGDPHTLAFRGRRVGFCSRACVPPFAARPEHYQRQIEAQQTARQLEGIIGSGDRNAGRVTHPLDLPHAHRPPRRPAEPHSAAAPPQPEPDT